MVSPVRRMWRGMADQRRELTLAGFTGTLASAAAVALLGVSGWLISTAATLPPVLTLTVASVLVRTFALSRAVFRYGERILGHDAAFRGLTSLRVAVFERMVRLAPVGLARFARGDMLNRLVADVDAALDLPLRVVLPWIQAGVVAALTVAFCAWLVPGAGVAIGVVAIIGVAMAPWLVGLLATRAERRIAPAKAELTSAVVASLDAVPDLVAFDRAREATQVMAQMDDRVTTLTRRSAAALGLGGGVTVALQGSAVVAALALTIPAVLDGRIAGVWLTVVALLPLALFEIVGTLPSSMLALQRLRGSADRIADLEDAPDPVPVPSSPVAVPAHFTGLALRGVSAGWDAGRPVLQDVDLEVRPGTRIAVVGPSGSGKSTLVAVLCGFLRYDGSYRLNGVEVSEATGDDVRAQVGVLSQQAHIFDTSIEENVRLGRPGVSVDAVWAALDQAEFGASVRAMPAGIATEVGSFGTAISGGEAQRLALARFLVDPRPVLVLDEPTEHLDATTAAALGATLRAITAELTTIEITHRVSTLEPQDRVVVLEAGRIVADATAGELAEGGGWFAQRLREERQEDDLARLIASLPIGQGVRRS